MNEKEGGCTRILSHIAMAETDFLQQKYSVIAWI